MSQQNRNREVNATHKSTPTAASSTSTCVLGERVASRVHFSSARDQNNEKEKDVRLFMKSMPERHGMFTGN